MSYPSSCDVSHGGRWRISVVAALSTLTRLDATNFNLTAAFLSLLRPAVLQELAIVPYLFHSRPDHECSVSLSLSLATNDTKIGMTPCFPRPSLTKPDVSFTNDDGSSLNKTGNAARLERLARVGFMHCNEGASNTTYYLLT